MQLRHLANRIASAQTAPAPAPAPGRDDRAETRTPNAAAILASIGEVAYEWDLLTDRLSWCPNLAEALGPIATADLSTGLRYGERLTPESQTSRYDAIFDAAGSDFGAGVPYAAIYALAPPRGCGETAPVWVEDKGRWFAGADGKPAQAHGVVRVVTERHEKERLLAQQSQFDPLTGVLNRGRLMELTQKRLQQAERARKPFAVLLAGLDNLCALNKIYGYDAGDAVLAGLASRLRAGVRPGDIVARHAANRFALVLEDCDADRAKSAAARLAETICAEPFETLAGPVPASIRMGCVVAPRDGRTIQTLFQHAEEALDLARQESGGPRFVAYASSLARQDQRLRALQVADNIVSALSENRVELAFQPIIDAATGAAAFYEALLRVRLADGSMVSPGALLPIAEKAGLVKLLDQRVLELAIARLAQDPALCASVNASLATVLDPEWPERLAASLRNCPGVAERLIIEITETAIIEDFAATRSLIAFCKQLGVKVAMDDFGAGHTSFRNLRELAFDLVKIDGAFVQNIVTSEDDRFFVRTLIDLARHLDLRIVAEWVENAETAALLRDWGVDYFQGALFGSPGASPLAPRALARTA